MPERNETEIQSRDSLYPVYIQATDLPDSWFQVIWEIMEHGFRYMVQRGSYEQSERIELDFATIHIKNPGSGVLLPDIPAALGIPNPASLKYVEQEYFPRYLMSIEKKEGEQYTYGERINQVITDDFLGITKTQLEWAVNTLRDTPNTNQATIEIAQPSDITVRSKDGHSDPPCLRLIDCRVRYGKLHLMVYFRSWDAWSGYPVNMAGIELLKQFMAGEIGVDNGELIASSKGLHVYQYAEEMAKIRTYMGEQKKKR